MFDLDFKINWIKALLLTSTTFFSFMVTYFTDLTLSNLNQFLAISGIILLDGFFGVWAGVKREGFKTYKAIKILKNLFSWVLILTVILIIEQALPMVSWISETILIPFILFELISALKNASMAGVIKKELINDVLDKVDPHKGKRLK